VTLTFRSLSLSKSVAQSDRTAASGGSSSGAGNDDSAFSGADEFMPLYIWVVLRSHIPMLCSTVAYILAYLNPARQMGRWGYCLINLSSAIEFVKYAEPDQFIVDVKDFEAKLMLAEKQLNGGF
jgi:hypothetical protein